MSMDSSSWLQSAQEFQKNALQQWQQLLQGTPLSAPPMANFGMPVDAAGNLNELLSKVAGTTVKVEQAKLAEIQAEYIKELAALWNQGLQVKPPHKDRRFSGEAWEKNPMSAYSAALYLLNARSLMAMAEAVEGDAKTKARVAFAVQQWIDASAPSNFLALNADARVFAEPWAALNPAEVLAREAAPDHAERVRVMGVEHLHRLGDDLLEPFVRHLDDAPLRVFEEQVFRVRLQKMIQRRLRVEQPQLNALIEQLGTRERIVHAEPPVIRPHLAQILDRQPHVLLGFGRQADHEVELDLLPAPGKKPPNVVQDVVLGNALVDHVPQPLGGGLRGHGRAR